MSVENCVEEVIITNRVEYLDWDIIKKGPLFLEFLRNRVICHNKYDDVDENGNPSFWGVIDWIEENSTDLWYVDGSNIYFYATEDAMAFKLRWV